MPSGLSGVQICLYNHEDQCRIEWAIIEIVFLAKMSTSHAVSKYIKTAVIIQRLVLLFLECAGEICIFLSWIYWLRAVHWKLQANPPMDSSYSQSQFNSDSDWTESALAAALPGSSSFLRPCYHWEQSKILKLEALQTRVMVGVRVELLGQFGACTKLVVTRQTAP